jgi:hypothetical protein
LPIHSRAKALGFLGTFPVRLRIRAKNGEKTRTSALVNSGFETEKPQLLIPLRLAREIGLWPPLPILR